jgi:branched-chain amino acid transport system ATP-binding protein
MLNVISGFYVPQEGEVWYKGSRRPAMKPFEVAQQGIARTFQNIALFAGLSVLENIKLGAHAQLKSGLFRSAVYLGPARREERELTERIDREILASRLKRSTIAQSFRYSGEITLSATGP